MWLTRNCTCHGGVNITLNLIYVFFYMQSLYKVHKMKVYWKLMTVHLRVPFL